MKRKIIIFFAFVFAIFSPAEKGFCLASQDRPEEVFFELEKVPKKIILRVKDFSQEIPAEKILDWIKEDYSIAFNPGYLSEIENGDICSETKSAVCPLLWKAENRIHIQKKTSLSLDRGALEDFLETLAIKSQKEPENAKFKMNEGKISVFSLGKEGYELDEEKSFDFVKEKLNQGSIDSEWNLPFIEKKPLETIDSIDNMGITELIGEGHSDFKGSPGNRIHNIKVATKKFDGLLIKPGEEFSFVKYLGPVDAENGYLPELVIKNDKTEPEFGGGICQVSTTVFRAAIYSGLEITSRKAHAYPVSYYAPHGMDAAIYIPRPDLKFINNTLGYILIQAEISGTNLSFKLYGAPDGRRVEIDGPKIIEKKPDGSMKTSFTRKIFDASGNLQKESVFNSNYDSPDKYPKPGSSTDILTEKPKSWSDKEWRKYKKAHSLP